MAPRVPRSRAVVPAATRTATRPGARPEARPDRLEVRKTYKLYVAGAFPRSESGRSYVIRAADGRPLANAVRASRKDLRDAVRAARAAFPKWQNATAMNRGQVLYRVAELMEGRRDQFVAEVRDAEGVSGPRAVELVGRAIDRWVWYAGWADKIAQVLGSSNPVAAPYFNFTVPEPSGVVGVVAPEASSLLGLVSRLAPVVVSGNAAIVLASEARPLPAVTLGEVLATSDVPGGVVNVLTGLRRELVPVLAAHEDVDALDTWGVPDALRVDVELAATDNVKRVARPPLGPNGGVARFDWLDDRATERPEWIAAFLELKTVWHPIGV
ncbi:MAG TPA: aldehyde dehydrogenase family protein [Candidatus Limnocylindrales bacterium]|nr:aldehyde dehydrogenase family protein [Candidatus Limnocylindrales bacterium]